MRGRLPCSSRNRARFASPISDPVASKMRTNRKARTTAARPTSKAPGISISMAVGARLGGMEKTPLNPPPNPSCNPSGGGWVTPNAIPATVTPRMAARMAPGTPRLSSAAITRNPAAANSAAGAPRSPRVTRVSVLAAMMPAFSKAMRTRNSPIPADMAIFCDLGMESIIHCRAWDRVSSRNRTPAKNTAPSAVCQGSPMPITTS